VLAAYALTEPQAGSDALAARTRADRSPDGQAYVLNGQKAWITNGGEADLFTVFAKVGGDELTAFLVERGFGVTSGREERKMGLDGTSTTALYFDNVRVPVENVLGDIGRGHVIALNVLNLARLEMGPIALRGAKHVLRESLAYARSRRAFGRAIVEFGAIQQKLADMAVRVFATESTAWRAVGLVAAATARRHGDTADRAEPAALSAHAIECAIVKVHASEMLDFVTDEGVQIHGGYGFHRDYHVERAFRDARVNRIFEGTNEINRLAVTRLLLKAAERGRLPLFDAIERVSDERPGQSGSSSPLAHEATLARRVRLLTLAMIGLARKWHGDSLQQEQEVSMRLADLIIETFVLQATIDRARTLGARGSPTAAACAKLYAHDAVPRIEHAALEIVSHSADAPSASASADGVRRLLPRDTIDAIGLRRQIAASQAVVGLS
jgi:alkylation response protein AidB-like acyl-CoA dehydrogenase